MNNVSKGAEFVQQFLRCDVTAEKFILFIYWKKNQRFTENLKLVCTIL